MCNPAAAVAVAGVAADTFQGQSQADAQNRYEQLTYGQRKEEAVENIALLNRREIQEREAASLDIQRVTSQARQAAGAAKLQALEAGVRGRSVDLLLTTFEQDRLDAVNAINRNLEYTTKQLETQRRAAGRIPPPRKHKGPLDSPLGLVGSVLGGVGAAFGNLGD